ncbi:hypothetical protein D3C81_2274400 [compost metagenome]
MLVDRVDMEQVVLHLADDLAEVRQVTAQHAGLVHAAQGVCDALWRLQDFHEQRTVGRILAELIVDLEARIP